jgi:hypothetical protein
MMSTLHVVQHHAVETERASRSIFATPQCGLFWLSLYGAGGIYWDLCDHLRDALPASAPGRAGVSARPRPSPGAVYTFLDNVFAPIRKYYRSSSVLAMLREHGALEARRLRGTGQYDDGELQIAAPYGPLILGEEGEVRIGITKL